MSTKLAILGTGTTLRFAPFGHPDLEYWGVAQLWGKVAQLDAVFDLYPPDKGRAEGLWIGYEKITAPIYMQEVVKTIPTSTKYPLDRVNEKLRPACRDKVFCTSTVAWMLALALVRQVRFLEINLYGVDMQQGSEYEGQLRSMEFLIGYAMGTGIKVNFPTESELLKTRYLYGFQDRARAEAVADLRERLQYFTFQRDQAAANEEADRAARLKYDAIIADTNHHLKRAGL